MVYRFTDATPHELAASAYAAASSITGGADPHLVDVTDPGTPRPSQTPLQPRAQLVVSDRSGRLLDSHMAQELVHAAHRVDQEHYDRQRDTYVGAYLAHLFTRPGRDRG